MSKPLKAPFPWFGGKSRAAFQIWGALGDTPNFVEPFVGSMAVLLNRPHPPGIETVNDKDGFVCNFWRALAADPEKVAHYADWPVNENDLHARHAWLVPRRAELTARLEGDPDYYDVQIAGWWVWGISCWIGSGWCSGEGPWQSVDGQLVRVGAGAEGVNRQLVHLGNAGQGIHRQRVHLGGEGQWGSGVHTKTAHGDGLYAWFEALAERLRRVRVCCGDWRRVLGPAPTFGNSLTGVLLDPPYSAEEARDMALYAIDDGEVAHAVRKWCLENGRNPLLRIVLCGYGTAHDALLAEGWIRREWKTQGGYGNLGNGRGRENATRETLWLSPHCLRQDDVQMQLW